METISATTLKEKPGFELDKKPFKMRNIPLNPKTLNLFLENIKKDENKHLVSELSKLQLSESLFDADGNVVIAKQRFLTSELIKIILEEAKRNNKGIFLFYSQEENAFIPIHNIILKPKPKDYQAQVERKIQFDIRELFSLGKENLPVVREAAKESVDNAMKSLKQGEIEGELRQFLDEILDEILNNVDNIALIASLGKLFDLDDGISFGHSLKAMKIGYNLAKELGFEGEELKMITKALLVHDIGKVLIPSEIIRKESALEDDEFDLIKLHPHLSFEILSNRQKIIDIIAYIAASHHRKEDQEHKKSYGSFSTHKQYLSDGVFEKGQKFAEDDFAIAAQRIVYLSDVFEALTCKKRTYKKPFSQFKALKIMKKEDEEGCSYSPYFKKLTEVIIKEFGLRMMSQESLVIIEQYFKKNKIDSQTKIKVKMMAMGRRIKKAYSQLKKEKGEPSFELLCAFSEKVLPVLVKQNFS